MDPTNVTVTLSWAEWQTLLAISGAEAAKQAKKGKQDYADHIQGARQAVFAARNAQAGA